MASPFSLGHAFQAAQTAQASAKSLLGSGFGSKLEAAAGSGLQSLTDLLSFTQHARLVMLDVGEVSGLVVEQAQGEEGLDTLGRFTVDVLSSSAHLELKSLVGIEARLSVRCASGDLRHWYGLVSAVSSRGADGGLARYRLTLSPWPVLLGLRVDSYVFQDQTTLETVESLLADYPLARFALRVSEETRAALPRHAIRTQYRESDWAFLTRLLAADGLSFWFEHDQAGDVGAHAGAGALRHTLVIADAASDWAMLFPATLPYHRVAATESGDAIEGLVAQSRIRTATVTRSGWNATQVAAPGAEESGSGGGASSVWGAAVPLLEDFDGGADPGRADLGAATARRIAGLRVLGHQADVQVFSGVSSVRTLSPGRVFGLTAHPDWSGQSFKVRSVSHRMSNNLRTGLDDAADVGARGTYRNTFSAVRAETPLAPLPLPLPADPGLLTALVVGLAGESATTERDQRVRIQFHFQRGLAPNPGGLTETGWRAEGGSGGSGVLGNAPGNETSGTWVRVAQAVAGPDWGMAFTPRIGTEVLVAFEQGDPDRPLIVGGLHNAVDLPPFQAGVGASSGGAVAHPGVISGIHTRVLMAAGSAGAAGFNQMLFDDAAEGLGAQLATSTLSSQLNLGALVLRSPGTAMRGAARGEGAELSTEGWAVLRAGQGALVSATARPDAAGSVLDATEAVAQMQGAAALAQALSDAAVAQGSPALTQPKDLAAFGQQAAATVPATGSKTTGQTLPAFSAPILLQETPASAALTSPASIVSFASTALHLTAQGPAHGAAGKTIALESGLDTSLFTHSGGLAGIAANGPLSVQAQTDALSVLADQSVRVTSTDGQISVFAQSKIVLQAGQCAITLEGGNITLAMPGALSVKGGQHTLAGGGKGKAAMPLLPKGKMEEIPHWIALHYLDAAGEPMSDVDYTVKFSSGEVIEGTLDSEGKARHEAVPNRSAQVEYAVRKPLKEPLPSPHSLLVAAVRSRLS